MFDAGPSCRFHRVERHLRHDLPRPRFVASDHREPVEDAAQDQREAAGRFGVGDADDLS